MTTLSPPFWDAINWDDSLEDVREARLRLAEAKAALRLWLRENAKQVSPSISMVVQWHKTLFEGVFPQFAGKPRGPNYPNEIPREVHFGYGKYYGVGHRFIAEALEEYGKYLRGLIAELDRFQATRIEFENQAVSVTAWLHADFIRIHPFINGNGRTGRLMIDFTAYRYDLHPVGPERPESSEYIEALDSYLQQRSINALVRFLFPLMVSTL